MEFSDAGNALIKAKGDKEPVGYYAFLETVKKKDPHRQAFKYKTVNAQAAGWIITRANLLRSCCQKEYGAK